MNLCTNRTSRTLASLAFGALAMTAFGMAAAGGGGGYDLSWNTIDGGGETSTGSNFALTGTIGQPDAGAPLAGSGFTLLGGFWSDGAPPATNPVAELIAWTMIKGTRIAGGLPEFENSDNTYFHTRSGFGQTFVDLHHMEMQLDAVTDVLSPSTLDVTIESRLNDVGGSAQVRMFNWNTSQYVQVQAYSINGTESVRQINGLSAANYVNQDGQIRMKIKHSVIVPIFAYQFQSFFDQVQIVVNP